jgi:signal transduction histidine kinase/Tfp pilus assembly protein PilF
MNREAKIKELVKMVRHEPLQVKEECGQILTECLIEGDSGNEYLCYMLLSDVYSHLGEYKEAKAVLEPAEKIAKASGDKEQLAKIHNNYGIINWYLGDYSNALSEYMKLKAYAEELNDPGLLFNAYNNIAMIYWIENKYELAAETYQKGFKFLDDKKSHKAANALNNIGLCYVRLDKLELAEIHLRQALEIFEQENDQKLVANSLMNIAHCHLVNNKNKEARENVEKATIIKRKINDNWGICQGLSMLARLYLSEDRLEESRVAFEEGLILSEKIGAKPLILDCYLIGSEYYELKEDFRKSLQYHRKYTEIWKEMHKKEASEKLAELEKDYRIKEKEKENEIYRLRNIELKQKNDLIHAQKKELDKTLQKLQILNDNLQIEIDHQVEELRNKDQMLIMQSRQAAMGEMLACIAHQWRQPLSGISIITQNLTDAWEFEEFNEEFLRKSCQKTLDLVNFMNNTITDFRDFFGADLEANDFDLKDVVQRTLRFVEHSLTNSNINLKLDLQEVAVHGFPNYYSQVVMNILNNARDVLEERKVINPVIIVKSFRSIDTKKSILTIEDNGGGVKEGEIKKIFNPYYTTKNREKGTGLGLYMSKVIIEENMKGRLSVNNTNLGACFKIEL